MRRRYQIGGLAALDEADEPADETVMDPEGDESEIPGGAVTSAGGLSALDIPGAAEAFRLMSKSSADARKALQDARASIMARQYNKADTLLAISGALGAPTRSGSTAESFANMSNALRGPLAAQQAFDIQKQRDLLGVNTQIAGLDEREAQARLALAQLQARLKNDLDKAGNDRIVGADGKLHYASHLDARQPGVEAWAPAGASTNVNLNTEKGFYGNWGETRQKKLDDLYESAQNAQPAIDRALRVKKALKEGAFTGTGAGFKLAFGKAAKVFGWNYADNEIQNTELMASDLAKGTLDLIGPSKLGGGTGFSNADRDFLNEVSGNKKELDDKTIDKLMDLHIRAQRSTVQKWNDAYKRLDKKQLDIMGITPVEMPRLEEEAAAPAAPETAAPTPPASQGAAAQSAPYGLAPAQWAIDPANPPPRAPPSAEKALKEHPEKQQEFLDKYGYLPNG